MQEKQIYPCSVHIFQRAHGFTRESADTQKGSFKKTVKMLPYESFEQDPQAFVSFLKSVFQEAQGELPFPARMCGATVMNFKSLQLVKCPSRKINNIYKKLDSED